MIRGSQLLRRENLLCCDNFISLSQPSVQLASYSCILMWASRDVALLLSSKWKVGCLWHMDYGVITNGCMDLQLGKAFSTLPNLIFSCFLLPVAITLLFLLDQTAAVFLLGFLHLFLLTHVSSWNPHRQKVRLSRDDDPSSVQATCGPFSHTHKSCPRLQRELLKLCSLLQLAGWKKDYRTIFYNLLWIDLVFWKT